MQLNIGENIKRFRKEMKRFARIVLKYRTYLPEDDYCLSLDEDEVKVQNDDSTVEISTDDVETETEEITDSGDDISLNDDTSDSCETVEEQEDEEELSEEEQKEKRKKFEAFLAEGQNCEKD